LWDGYIFQSGLFRWVWGCREGFGVCTGWGLGSCLSSFAGQGCGRGCGCVVVGVGGGGGFGRCIIVFMMGSQLPMRWVSYVLDKRGHLRVQFPNEDVSQV
jgi:hypothetical protein